MSAERKRVLWDSFTFNVFLGEEYLDDHDDGLADHQSAAAEDAIETLKAAFVENLASRLGAIVGPNVGVTITER